MSPLLSLSQNSLISVGTHVSGPSPLLIWRAASWSWTIGKSHRRWVQDLGSYHITERGAGIPGRHRRAGSELIAILSLYCPPPDSLPGSCSRYTLRVILTHPSPPPFLPHYSSVSRGSPCCTELSWRQKWLKQNLNFGSVMTRVCLATGVETQTIAGYLL